MLNNKSWLLSAVVIFAGFTTNTLHAAPLTLGSGAPDVGFQNLVSYTAPTCFNSGSGSASATGICGTTSGTKVFNGGLSTAGILTITDLNTVSSTSSTMFYNDVLAGGTNSNAGFFGDFTLRAYFNNTGTFVSSITDTGGLKTSALSLTLTSGTVTKIGGGTIAAGSTIETANLTTFGFNNLTGGTAGGFQFRGNVTGGYWATLLAAGDPGNNSKTISNVTLTSGAWDSTLFMRNWSSSSTSNSVDTFVPLPAAGWLLGSGLLGLVGFGRRCVKS